MGRRVQRGGAGTDLPLCGVTTLPSELSHVLDTAFVCDNADRHAYGERIDS